MIRQLLCFLLFLGLMGCQQQSPEIRMLGNRIDSLEQQLTQTYQPGFGEFMSRIQAHHMKLWFAGQYGNWDLADFEIHEILETVQDIQSYETEREESKEIGIVLPAIDSVSIAIKQQDPELFRQQFTLLTNTCNACHELTHFAFNVVKTPTSSPFSNQDFSGRH